MKTMFKNQHVKVPKPLRATLPAGMLIYVWLGNDNKIFLSKQPANEGLDDLLGATLIKEEEGIFLTQDAINRLYLKDENLVEMSVQSTPYGDIVYLSRFVSKPLL